MFGELINGGSTPALEAAMRFAAQRQRLIAHNIANIETPNYQHLDVSVEGFQSALREAIQSRRDAADEAPHGPYQLDTDELHPTNPITGEFELKPSTNRGGIMFHDRNNRDTERLMQDLVENATAFRVASDLVKGRYDLLKSAIAERP